MAKAADQFKSSDVTMWGIVALSCWAFAVLAANLSAIVPPSVFAAMHASRLDGGTLNQLRTQVANLDTEAARVKRENNQLLQRFALNEETAGLVTRRVGALEVSLPRLIEAQNQAGSIDSAVTGSIGDGRVVTFEADGGSVAVQQKPLLPGDVLVVPAAQPIPAEIASSRDAMGVALAFPVDAADAEAQWQGFQATVGTLLIGLAPVLAPPDGTDKRQMIAGPLTTTSRAAELCGRLERVGIPCKPAPFVGEPVKLLD